MTDDELEIDSSSVDTTTGHGEAAAPTRAADAVTSPRQIGPYTIQKVVGRGGMGVVYLAHDPRARRDVALKVIPAGPEADPTDLARFKTEAEAVARLDHPNIVRLYEVGEADHVAYLAMEFVEGGTLYKQIKGGRKLDILDSCRIVEQISRAIHYAHQHGVVHRDLKPSNILLKNTIGGEQSDLLKTCIPKLADFGLAKQLDQSLRLTRTGTAVGTPHYMAPEQARGESAIGPALDIHGLGAILYELLTGSPPYSGDSAAETMEQVVYKTPVRLRQLRPEIPPVLEALCLKCLEKEPRKRYRSAAGLADELRRFIDNPTRTSAAYVDRGRPWRKALPFIGAAVLFAALTAIVTWYITSRAHRTDLAVTQRESDSRERSARRASLEAAIALCEQGHVRLGLQKMRELDSDEDLPVREFIAAWRGRSFEVVKTIPEMHATIIAVSPSGDKIAAAEGDRVRLWNTADWLPLGDGWNIGEKVTAIGWSESGTQLAIATVNGSVLIAHANTGQMNTRPVVEGKGKSIAAVAFAFTGIRIVHAGNTLRQEYVPALESDANKSHPFNLSVGPVSAVGIAPMTGDAAAVLGTGAVRVYDGTDARWRDLPPDGDVTAVAFSSDANVLAIGTRAGAVRLWDAIARVPLTDVHVASGRIASIAVGYSQTTYFVVVCTENAPAIVLRCERPWVAPPIRVSDRPGNEVLGVGFAPGAEKVYVTSAFGVSLWRVRDGKRYGPERNYSAGDRYKRPKGEQSRFSTPVAPIEKDRFVVGSAGGKMFLVDGSDGRTVKESDQPSNEVTALATRPNGQMASAYISDGRSVIRHWQTGLESEPCSQELASRVHQEAFLPDGSAVLLACDDGFVRVWDPVANHLRLELNCGSPVLSVAASADGKYILAGCANGMAQLWDPETIAQVRILRHRSEVRGVAFHEGRLLTASADGTARRWNMATGLPLGPPLSHPDAISTLSVWGDLLATGGRGRYVRIWRVD